MRSSRGATEEGPRELVKRVVRGLDYRESLLVNITHESPVWRGTAVMLAGSLREPTALAALRLGEDRLWEVIAVGTDAFFAFYSAAPLLRDDPPSPEYTLLNAAWAVLYRFMASREYMEARRKTTLNRSLSLVLAAEFLENLIRNLTGAGGGDVDAGEGELEQEEGPQDYCPLHGVPREECGCGGGGSGESQDDARDDRSGGSGGWAREAEKLGGEARAVAGALREALDSAKTASQLLDAAPGVGKEPGSFERILDLTRYIKRFQYARMILEYTESLRGKLPRTVRVKRRVTRVGEELWGYGRTRRFERALARELSLPYDLLVLKASSGGLLTLEKALTLEGPIYVLLDKSGSMLHGFKLIWSRSVAFALMQVASAKGVPFYIRFFDAQVYDLILDPLDAADAILRVIPDGGTNIDLALNTALDDIAKMRLPEHTTTLVLITDGQDYVSIDPGILEALGVRLITIITGEGNEYLQKISHAYYTTKATTEDAITLIEEARK